MGKYKYSDGSLYEGSYSGGKKHGRGKYIAANKTVF